MSIFQRSLFIMPQLHDLDYSSCVAEEIVREICSRLNIHMLVGSNADPWACDAELKSWGPIDMWGCGHGGPDHYTVECTELWLDANRPETLRNLRERVIHLISCRTARILGPAIINAGAYTYFGYYDDFWLFTKYSPCANRATKSMHRCDLEVEVALSRGRTTGQAESDCEEYYNDEIDYWESSPSPDAEDVLYCLRMDRIAFRRFGRSDIRIAPQAPEAPEAHFSGSPRSGAVPLTVQFTDKSEGDIDRWRWTFGDGGTSSSRNPSHTYHYPGYYDVALEVTGPGGTDTEYKEDYIHATETPPPTKCILTISATIGGRTEPPVGHHEYDEGQRVTIIAYPYSGYEFQEWKFNGETRKENPITITMTRDYSLHAVFKESVTPPPPPPEEEDLLDNIIKRVEATKPKIPIDIVEDNVRILAEFAIKITPKIIMVKK